jgi:hypothetical protein
MKFYFTLAARAFRTSTYLLNRLPGGAFRVFELPLAFSFLAQVAAIQKLILDLLKCQASAGGMFRPSHIGPVKITAIGRSSVEFFKWYYSRSSGITPLLYWWFTALPFLPVIA